MTRTCTSELPLEMLLSGQEGRWELTAVFSGFQTHESMHPLILKKPFL